MGSETERPVAHPNRYSSNINASLVYIDRSVQSARREPRSAGANVEWHHPAGYVFGIAARAP